MLGAVIAWFCSAVFGGFFLGLAAAVVVVGGLAAVTERLVLRRIEYHPERTIVATIGLLYILQQARADRCTARTPARWPPRVLPRRPSLVRLLRLQAGGGRAVGRAHRRHLAPPLADDARPLHAATQQDREMAQAFGVPVGRVYTLAFALGAALAAVGGRPRRPRPAGPLPHGARRAADLVHGRDHRRTWAASRDAGRRPPDRARRRGRLRLRLAHAREDRRLGRGRPGAGVADRAACSAPRRRDRDSGRVRSSRSTSGSSGSCSRSSSSCRRFHHADADPDHGARALRDSATTSCSATRPHEPRPRDVLRRRNVRRRLPSTTSGWGAPGARPRRPGRGRDGGAGRPGRPADHGGGVPHRHHDAVAGLHLATLYFNELTIGDQGFILSGRLAPCRSAGSAWPSRTPRSKYNAALAVFASASSWPPGSADLPPGGSWSPSARTRSGRGCSGTTPSRYKLLALGISGA